MQVMDHLKKNKLISPVDKNKSEDLCCSCQMAKACRLPFLVSNKYSDEPFAKVHYDL